MEAEGLRRLADLEAMGAEDYIYIYKMRGELNREIGNQKILRREDEMIR